MYTEKNQSIQRTLVVAAGDLAHQTVHTFHGWLKEPGQPTSAVSVVDVPLDPEPDVLESMLVAGFTAISQVTMPAQLAQIGWRLDRPAEVAVFLVVDPADGGPEPTALAAMVAELARQQWGVETAVMLLAILPAGDRSPGFSQILAATAQPYLFARGVAVVSLINEVGLCLPDLAALVNACALLLDVLVLTPLRDAPEWLAANQAGRDQAGQVFSLGVSQWRWQPQAIQMALANRWVCQIIDQWQATVQVGGATTESRAWVWLETTALLPEQVMDHLLLPGELWLPPVWHYPQPWQWPDRCAELRRPVVAETEPESVDIEARLMALLAEAKQALRTAGSQLLDNDSVGGLALLRTWATAVSAAVETIEDRIFDQGEAVALQLAALEEGERSYDQEIEDLLAGWPETTWRAWLRAVFSPWRWPELGWRYWQLAQNCRRWADTQDRRRQLIWQQARLAATARFYTELQGLVRQFDSQVEEIGEMLTMGQAALWAKPLSVPEADLAAWALMRDGSVQEAALAVKAVGGLGRQLSRLDDAILGDLLATGRARFSNIGGLTAVEALQQQVDTPDKLVGWWLEMTSLATPLWRYDETEQAALRQARPDELLLFCGAEVSRLESALGPARQHERRVLAADRERLIVLRLRGGIPLPQVADENAAGVFVMEDDDE